MVKVARLLAKKKTLQFLYYIEGKFYAVVVGGLSGTSMQIFLIRDLEYGNLLYDLGTYATHKIFWRESRPNLPFDPLSSLEQFFFIRKMMHSSSCVVMGKLIRKILNLFG